ncbi:MAG: HEAT repeat domain-containing protein [Planctomycetota bacterium]|nr:HEAT repeat domain-containing protein [Planctomycetota bacterium]
MLQFKGAGVMRRLFLLIALTSACAGAGQAPSERADERRALFSAWSEGPEPFKLASIGLEEDPGLARLWAEDLVVVMVASYRSQGVSSIGQLNGRFERARWGLLELGEVAVEPLVEMLLLGNEIGAHLALETLIEGRERSAAPLLAAVMSGAPASARARAASALGELAFAGEREDEVFERLESVLRDDPMWVCRVNAARSLRSRADRAGAVRRVRGALTSGLGDADEEVRDACCIALAELGDRAAVPALINHLERVVRQGSGLGRLRNVQAALRWLTKTKQDLAPRAWRRVWLELQDSRQG